ncbi:unnamed protein product [Adineta ricciae]|uniref:Cation efflux protein cytoplasmic domain-containing protein n=1 Tax=Adineta ricciae TaxID=249248 RepID=A0A814FL92_ADIRI|nr:unnamed protein product [Adineta ricciae]
MDGIVISVDKYSDDMFSNTAKYNLAKTTTTKSDQRQSSVQIKTQNQYRKSPEVSAVTLVRMTQLAPEEPTINDPSPNSLKHILRQRQGICRQDPNLSEPVKRFYRRQDDLINGYTQVEKQANNNDEEREKNDHLHTKSKRMTLILSRLSLAVNILLFLTKTIAAILSKSLSIASTVVDSAVDLASSVILFWAARAMKKRNIYLYPQGRTRLEPVAIVILSVIMCAASVMVVYNSVDILVNEINYFTETNTTKTLSQIDMSAFPVTVMCFTAVSKAILFFLCYRVKTPTMSALAEDHRNDVASNIIALGCGLIGSYAYQNTIDRRAIVVDPVGAILISVYIIISWIKQANRQIKRLTGYTAKPQFLSQITWLTFHHSEHILKIDTVRAFHFGTSFLVEVHIVLPETMLVKEAHDIAEGLQQKIERLPEVERAFVHIDYECQHKPTDEHKIV